MPPAPLEILLLSAAFAAAAGHLWALGTGRGRLALWLKPAPVLLALLLVLAAPDPHPARYRLFVALALVFSAVGDVLLAPSVDRFIPGLLFFLSAHLLYSAAFLSLPAAAGGGAARLLLAAIVIGLGAGMGWLLWPHVQGAMRSAVLLYLAVILGMLWLSGAQRATFVPALLFVASDSVLALDKFRARIPGVDGIVMVTYYTAQILFALSVLGRAGGV